MSARIIRSRAQGGGGQYGIGRMRAARASTTDTSTDHAGIGTTHDERPQSTASNQLRAVSPTIVVSMNQVTPTPLDCGALFTPT